MECTVLGSPQGPSAVSWVCPSAVLGLADSTHGVQGLCLHPEASLSFVFQCSCCLLFISLTLEQTQRHRDTGTGMQGRRDAGAQGHTCLSAPPGRLSFSCTLEAQGHTHVHACQNPVRLHRETHSSLTSVCLWSLQLPGSLPGVSFCH